MMHVYRKHRDGGQWMYTVGYFEPVNREQTGDYGWVPLEDTSKEEEARQLVNYLNGGEGRPFRYDTLSARGRDQEIGAIVRSKP